MWVNWWGGQQCRPRRTDRPLDEAGVVAAVRRAAERGLTVRPLGSGRSDSTLTLTNDVHVDCSALTGVAAITSDTVRARAGATLASVQAALAPRGRALAPVAHAPLATVAGAIATGTHGGGAGIGSLSDQVVGMRFVDGTGRVRKAGENGDVGELDAVRTGLGALGVVTEVELRTVPATEVEAHEEPVVAEEALAVDGPLDAHRFAAVELHLPSGEALLRWAGPVVDREPEAVPGGPVEALGRVVTRLGHTASAQWSAQRSRPAPRWEGVVTGPPHELLPDPHPVRGGFTEWALPREALADAIRALGAATTARDQEIRRPVEVRTGPAETGWLHPAHGRATAWITVRTHRGDDHGPLFRLVGSVLEGMGGRPHWGGRHDWTAADVAVAYPALPDFLAVRDRLDPDRLFNGDHLEALLGP
ncbi:D-arabinono-1,4-lactone oxidase [Pseudonocardia halophobica]|uniref:Oxidoreductase n=1 Tax=Pseudonocardia halophobica TaxID=29401 RepID=A0A9W6KXK2_9PSEU|nr:D-arabinono-1,4-lactone oxidase [Pseudonocardia halophobica]GLL09112.1 putative oxidoreductase [Pseudonocardia halophobica]